MLHVTMLSLTLLKQFFVYAIALTMCNDKVAHSNFPSPLVLVCCLSNCTAGSEACRLLVFSQCLNSCAHKCTYPIKPKEMFLDLRIQHR